MQIENKKFESLVNLGVFDVIVVDPPWPVKKLKRSVRPNQVSMDYATMSLDAIGEFPVAKLANDNSWCFLWTTQKFLFDARHILEHWGFHYLLMLVWKKEYGRSAGMPLFGFCWNAEFILVGCKTKPELWPKRSLIPACFSAENIKHSEKPNEFYRLVEPLGNKRIDVFARKQREGWTVWGDEVNQC